MAHEFESGFFVAQAAWHGLGTVLQNAPTTEEAIIQAGLDWRVVEEPIIQNSDETAPTLRKKLVRDRDQSLLGIVPPDYVPLQNQEAFRWFNPLLEQGQIQLEAAGSLRMGRCIWVLAQLTQVEATVRFMDWVRPYLLLHNTHDGSTAVWLQFTPVRVVCMNTLGRAASSRFDGLWQKQAVCIPHTLALHDQLEMMQNLVDVTQKEFDICVDEYRAMASQEVNSEMLATYMGRVLGSRTPHLRPEWEQLVTNFEQGRGNLGRTLWDAYNAVTEWLDHQRGIVAEERLHATWFGAGAQIRTYAHEVALEMVSKRPKLPRSPYVHYSSVSDRPASDGSVSPLSERS